MAETPFKRIILHDKQHEIFADKSRFRVVSAGRRFGKTVLSGATIIDAAISKPGSLNWYVAPSYRMAKQIMWNNIHDYVPRDWIKKQNSTLLRLELKNGSAVEFKGCDRPDLLRGVGLDFLVMDEMQDIRGGVWSAILRPTLATTKGKVLFIGTPKSYNSFYDLWMKGQDPNIKAWKSWQFRTADSPFVPEEEIKQAMEDMDMKTFQQEFMAEFANMTGRVYYSFDRDKHVGNYAFNPELPICVGQDFNIDPMSSAIFQPQPNGEVWAIDEICLAASNTQEICDELERRYWKYAKQIVIYPDPAGNARQHARGETDLDIFREKGFKNIKFHKQHPRVADRVNSVNSMLQTAAGVARLKIDNKCTQLIKSLEQTIYKEKSRQVDKTLGTDHMADAAGYFLQYEYPVRKFKAIGYSR